MPYLSRPSRVAVAAFGAAALLGGSDAAVLKKSVSESGDLSFENYLRVFGRSYESGSEEYRRRGELFQASLLEVAAVNARNAKEGKLWKAGIHPFMDWNEAERRSLNGYKPSPRAGRRGGGKPSSVALLHTGSRAFGRRSGVGLRLNATRRASGSEVVWSSEAEQGGLTAEAGPAMRNQGNCGSCWAISAVEAVEAQLQRAGGDPSVRVSAQALVDCVPNPQHCGGKGGCDGATGELAYAFMRDHGIPTELDLPYSARTRQCPQHLEAGLWQNAASRVRVGGWDQLPSNKAQPLMRALVEKGPVVVAVDANNWFNYDSGIFDGCDKDATLGHAVLAKGYAADTVGNKYWLIQNSWGAEWGENGHIRLLRRDSEDSWCGTDRKPEEGVGCEGGPSEVTVCGTCGLLFDPLVPSDVRIESSSSSSSAGSGVGPSLASFDAGQMSSSSDQDSMDSFLHDFEQPAP